MNATPWQAQNLEAIERRLEGLRDLADGVIFEESSPLQQICIIKQGNQILLYFVDPNSGALDGPMSRIDIDHPLRLPAEYAQAALLTLLWEPEPQRVCVLGFGGGRISMILHHYLPQVVIDNVDIDPALIPIAELFFGIAFDERQRITIQDGRAFLEQADPGAYDIIIMDAFRDQSDALDHLATTQFYEICAAQLTRSGVFCANMLKSDAHLWEKMTTFRSHFRYVHVSEHKYSAVLFGAQHKQLTPQEQARHARELQQAHRFDFPFVEQTDALQFYRDSPYAVNKPDGHISALTDETPLDDAAA
jgi:spermidine synthase